MRYSHITPNSHVDGPGKRTVIFLQGCTVGCLACQNVALWDKMGGKESAALALALAAMSHGNKNITISGGEPTDQPEELYSLVAHLINIGAEHILIYSGRTWEELMMTDTAGHRVRKQAVSLADVVVDGPFIKAQDDPLITWRGSRNQRVIDVRCTLEKGEIVELDWNAPKVILSPGGEIFLPAGLVGEFEDIGEVGKSRMCGQTKGFIE